MGKGKTHPHLWSPLPARDRGTRKRVTDTHKGFRKRQGLAGSCGRDQGHAQAPPPPSTPSLLEATSPLRWCLTWATRESIPSASVPGSVLPSREPSGELREGTGGLRTEQRQERVSGGCGVLGAGCPPHWDYPKCLRSAVPVPRSLVLGPGSPARGNWGRSVQAEGPAQGRS